MSDLLASSEFGDWLLNEIPRTRRQAKSADPECAQAAAVRLESLRVAKRVLLEFLTLQQAMMEAAHAARTSRATYADQTPCLPKPGSKRQHGANRVH